MPRLSHWPKAQELRPRRPQARPPQAEVAVPFLAPWPPEVQKEDLSTPPSCVPTPKTSPGPCTEKSLLGQAR